MTVAVAVAVARADDDRARWPRRRGARRGGQVAVTVRGGAPAAGAPAVGGGGDGRAFQGREPHPRGRGGHLAAAAARGGRGGRGGGGGAAAGDAPPGPGAGRGRGGGAGGFGAGLGGVGGAGGFGAGLGGGGGADIGDAHARRGAGGRDGDENRTGPAIRLREDALDWLLGNVNNMDESSRCTADQSEMNPRPLPKQKIHPAHHFLPFNEQEEFENNLDPQGPEIDELNDDLVVLYESIAAVRRTTYEMMCRVAEAKDPSSYGKKIGEESTEGDKLIKNAEGILAQIEGLGGEAIPIPYQFYVGVKPLKP